MAISFDDQVIALTCPGCRKQLKEEIGRLKRDKHVTCPTCGRVAVNTDELRQIEDRIKKELAKLGGKAFRIKL